MNAGVRGRLVSASFVRDLLAGMPGAVPVPPEVSRRLEAWSARIDALLGPASSVRAVTDVAVIPLLEILGLAVTARVETDGRCVLDVRAGPCALTGIVTGWGASLATAWQAAVVHAIAVNARWCLCWNGASMRIVDARHTWSRDYLELDTAVIGRLPQAQAVLWALARREAMMMQPPLLDRAVTLSAQYGMEICRALGTGVLEALRLLLEATGTRQSTRQSPQVFFEQSLTVLYRVLFLLFAEARGLVPLWHPVYRDRYSLNTIVTTLLSGRRCHGLWQAIQAISRLAHAGCRTGELRVTAFNGRLFSPAHVSVFDRATMQDEVMGRVVVAVSSTPGARSPRHTPGTGRARIVYRDLDVEQLGAVYEQVLEYEPAVEHGRVGLTYTRDVRKSSGAFYTPRAVTAFLVRRTLEPLTRDRTASEILELKVLDPAMGSGAFLVAACRYLASAIEDAMIGEGRWHAHDVTPADRVALRREVASRCLFGVDLNPMAVQLARLSLWLATLAADKPLSFLDHHLATGDSLLGATPDDVRRQPSHVGKQRRQEPLPLFDADGLPETLEEAVRLRMNIASSADETVAVVRQKERILADLQSRDTSLGRWSRVLDLWCAGWFWEGPPPTRGTFRALAAHLLDRDGALPDRIAAPLLTASAAIAARQRFLHWPLMFPEAFADERGNPLANPGFDAVIGNPPWDMVRGDSGDGTTRTGRRLDARRVTDFIRGSGIYRVETRAHVNRYQLFVERALQLVGRGGRIGYVLPAGVASDTGAAALRRHLFDRAEVDEITGLDNREAIFPIHRSMRFVLLTCTAGRPTGSIRCRFGISRAEDVERDEQSGGRAPLVLTRKLLTRLSGDDDLGIPELTTGRDLEILERISADVPRLFGEHGWGARFGRELNASDDRDAFVPFSRGVEARPVVEGKQIEPFRVSIDRCRLELRADAATRVNVARRARLAYRDVASATNRVTLIAAIVPARAVTTHTLICLRTPLPLSEQRVLCALLNSFVANYLVRFRVNTHLTVSLVSRLFVPVVRTGHPLFDRLLMLSRRLTAASTPIEEMPEYAELQAHAAHLYRLSTAEFEHVLSTFPLIHPLARNSALAMFEDFLRTAH